MIGVDMVVVSRIEKLMEKFGEKALHRFLSNEEISLVKKPTNAAGFWAAKEAASKALGTGIGSECSFHDIFISKTDKGAPKITFSQEVLKKFAIKDSSLSITHDGGLAIAVVAIEKESI
jgi:holo-[acyl-carrier protein] synthase